MPGRILRGMESAGPAQSSRFHSKQSHRGFHSSEDPLGSLYPLEISATLWVSRNGAQRLVKHGGLSLLQIRGKVRKFIRS
jgi:hypothetical protein